MAKTCPSCGFQTADDQSVYCNKCGYPFPKVQPIKPPVTQIAGAPPARRAAPRPVSQPASRPVRRRAVRGGGFLSFGTLIGKKYSKEIYILGAVVIVLASIMGIAGLFAKPGAAAANVSFTNTTALAQDPAGSSLFWIVFLIAGSLLWRIFCELCVAVFRLDDAPGHGGTAVSDEVEEPVYYDEVAESYVAEGPAQMVECPHCQHIVPADDLRECEHCGVQGCSNCIRMMGLLKKTMTCRACFEGE